MWTEISPNELKNLYANAQLTPGESYAFDFQTKHIITGTNELHIGDTEKIVLTAATTNKFFKNALSLDFPSDIIGFDFDNNVCEDGITPRLGKIISRRDINNNETPFDFRNVVHRRYDFDAPIWDGSKKYIFGELARLGNKIYRWAAPPVLDEISNGGSPNTTFGWLLFIDLDKLPYPFWTKDFNYSSNSENPGYFNPIGVTAGTSYKDFYTFGNSNGEEKSEWFNNIIIDEMKGIDYPNIVFIENQSNQSYNAHFVGQCNNLTILSKFVDNGLIEMLKNTVIGSNCKYNRIRQLSKAVIGDNFTENIMTHRLSFDHFGNNVTGNHFLGECVGTTLDSYAQNILGVDFSFNLAVNQSYNTIGNFVWHCVFPPNFSNNYVFCPAQDVYMPVVDNTQIISDGFDYYVQSFNGANLEFTNIIPPSLQ